jgi:hypothetical protein
VELCLLATGVLWQVIAELDEKKREALQVTWEKVNKDFGSIFSTLLPGTSAKLEPPEGKSFLAGQPDALACLEGCRLSWQPDVAAGRDAQRQSCQHAGSLITGSCCACSSCACSLAAHQSKHLVERHTQAWR